MRTVAARERLKKLVPAVLSFRGIIKEQTRCIPARVSHDEAEPGLWFKMPVSGFARKMKEPATLIGDRIECGHEVLCASPDQNWTD